MPHATHEARRIAHVAAAIRDCHPWIPHGRSITAASAALDAADAFDQRPDPAVEGLVADVAAFERALDDLADRWGTSHTHAKPDAIGALRAVDRVVELHRARRG